MSARHANLLLFTELEKSLALHILFSFVFGGAVSGMAYANLSAGIIKSVRRSGAACGIRDLRFAC